MKPPKLIVTLFLLAFAFAPRMWGMPPPPPNFSCQANFADGWTGSLPWAESQGRVADIDFEPDQLAVL